MMKKGIYSVSALLALCLAGHAYASREFSINYEYYDANGFTVGSGYLPCSGALVVQGQITNNAVEVDREACGGTLPVPDPIDW